MFSRLFTLTERLARLAVRGSVWVGSEWLAGVANIGRRFRPHTPATPTRAPDESDRIQGQVRWLSGLIIGLLAAVVLLLLWATSPKATVSPVINFFNLITPAAPDTQAAGAGANATPLPDPLSAGGTIAFTMRPNGQDDLYAIKVGDTQPLRLTSHPADDRDPAWSPDGEKLAFASRRDGNWELYVLDVFSGEITRVTFDTAYQAAPSWSPDGTWLAYEGYQDGNLDIYIIRVDGSEGPFRLTFSPAPDYQPAWSSAGAGREIAYVSWRDGNQEIYLLSLDDPREETAVNVTNTPDLNEEHPAWSPGGLLLAYSVGLEGTSLVYAKPTSDLNSEPSTIGQGHNPAWSPDGASLVFTTRQAGRSYLLAGQYGSLGVSEEAVGLPSPAQSPAWTAASLPRQLRGSILEASNTPVMALYEEQLLPPEGEGKPPYQIRNLEGVDSPASWLSDRVDDSYVALRQRLAQEAGWDVLGRADHVWWKLDRPVEPGQDPQNWHKAGRAFDLVQGYIEGQTPLVQPVLEQQGVDVYWRLYVRAAEQDGSLGEPLKQLPWDFTARFSGEDVEAYDRGGKLRDEIPGGYYVDLTRLAEDYGWTRVPSDSSWRYNWAGVLFWQYEKRDGLDWLDAMLEIYPEEEVRRTFSVPGSLPTSAPAAQPAGGVSTRVPNTIPAPVTTTPAPVEATPDPATEDTTP